VTFHETFWVVTGSTAPVVALAAIISAKEIAHDTGVITDPVGEMVAAHVTGPKMEQAHSYCITRSGHWWAMRSGWHSLSTSACRRYC
jgi:hypothetical protein